MCTKRYWYYYDGSGDQRDPYNYMRLNIDPSICPGGTDKCAVYACPNPVNPNIPQTFSENLLAYCIIARTIGTHYPLFPNKPFVYTKPMA